MIEEKAKKIMSTVLSVPISEINDDVSPHSIPTWDSLKHIDLILTFEKEFGIKFTDEEIPTMISFGIIVITIKSYVE